MKQTGHVLRFDSFSKVLSAGIRIGFASGPTPLLAAIDMHVSCDTLQFVAMDRGVPGLSWR